MSNIGQQIGANIRGQLAQFLEGSAEDLERYGQEITRDLETAIARQNEAMLEELRAQLRALGAKRAIEANQAGWALLDHIIAAGFHTALAALRETALNLSSGPGESEARGAGGFARLRLVFLAGLILAAALAICGCGAPGTIPASEIRDLVRIVTDRHDAYVEADAAMDETEKSVALRSSEILRDVVETAAAR
ncbi:MAG: hypothetical protein RL885_25165 [Planctomycetota bacterium]